MLSVQCCSEATKTIANLSAGCRFGKGGNQKVQGLNY